MPYRDRDREELDDDEFPEPGSGDDDGNTLLCPHCRVPVYDQAEQCPYCGTYLTEEDSAPRHKPLWIVVGTVACLAVVYLWIRYGV